MSSSFDQEERGLAKRLGVPQKNVAAARHVQGLEKGRDWEVVRGAVAYCGSGVQKILAALGLGAAVQTLDVLTPAAKKNGAAGPLEGRVVRKFTNRHLIEVAVATPGEVPALARVWVRDSKNFRPGMVVPVVLEAGVWRVGRREPRWFGRW